MATLEVAWKSHPDGQRTATVITPFGLEIVGTGKDQHMAALDLIRMLSREGYWVRFLPDNMLTKIEAKMA
jgi:hypothetical protein